MSKTQNSPLATTIDEAIKRKAVRATDMLPPLTSGSALVTAALPVGTMVPLNLRKIHLETPTLMLKPMTTSAGVDIGAMTTGSASVCPPPISKMKLDVPIYSADNTFTTYGLYRYCVWNWMNLFTGNPTDKELIAGLVGGYLSVVDVTGVERMSAALAKNNYLLEVTSVNADLESLIQDVISKYPNDISSMISIMKEIVDLGKEDDLVNGTIALTYSMLFLSTTKRIISDTDDLFFEKRYRALAARSGFPRIADMFISAKLIPNRAICGRIHSTVGGLFYLRREMFGGIRDYVKADSAPFIKVFEVLLGYMSFTEMTHIQLINSFIIRDYPEVATLKCLQGSRENLQAAVSYLSSLPKGDMPYAKILFPPEETRCINSNNFPQMCAAARLIAAKTSKSMVNYKGSLDGENQMLATIIDNYLQLQGGVGLSAIVRSPQSNIDKDEQTRILARYEEEERGAIQDPINYRV